jgi:hypothetical protein
MENASTREVEQKEHYETGFDDGHSIGKREILDPLHNIVSRLDSYGYDNVSKQDIVAAVRTIATMGDNDNGQVGSVSNEVNKPSA